ncbi:hypothetical protein A4X13_0g3399 [Tilletia indica]|uniref:glucan 1,3-beta-glucosidase n=1 Tax=Tilletia indica TaxID=43049 RepID=A0A177TAW7_9BASI|nr:hypothetical protein A4X13_0g3399 [Tilletia indica]
MRWSSFAAAAATSLLIALSGVQVTDARLDTRVSPSSLPHRSAIATRYSPESQARVASLPEANFTLNGVPARGVNLGGWWVTESWMQPNFYRDAQLQNEAGNFSFISDEGEWMLSYANRSEAKEVLRQHYQTWITEKDFQEMKALGLNAVRLVIPYWTLEEGPPAYAANLTNTSIITTTNDTIVPEPFFYKGQRKYVRAALRWAKQYGLQVVLDLHTVPGSQNGFDNSGKAGRIDWDNNPDYYNRTLKCLVTMVDWYVNNPDPLYSGVVKAIGVMNEPRVGKRNTTISIDFLKQFYIDSYNVIRDRVSAAEGAKVMPTLMFSDGLIGAEDWLSWYRAMFSSGTFKRGTIIMDQHLYQAFQPLNRLNRTEHISYTCGLSKTLARTQSVIPVVIGEMSMGLGGACGYYPDCWDHTMEDDVNRYNTPNGNLYFRKFWEAQQLAFEGNAGGWFMWNWNTFSASQWSYRDSVAQGWIPRNLNERVFLPNATEVTQGRCVSLLPNRNLTFATESAPPPPPPPSNSTNTTLSSSMLSTASTLGPSMLPTSSSISLSTKTATTTTTKTTATTTRTTVTATSKSHHNYEESHNNYEEDHYQEANLDEEGDFHYQKDHFNQKVDNDEKTDNHQEAYYHKKAHIDYQKAHFDQEGNNN